MKNVTLSIFEIETFNLIYKTLSEQKPLTKNQQLVLQGFLAQLPSAKTLLEEKVALEEPIEVDLLEVRKIDESLTLWRELFDNLPGWDYCPFAFFVGDDNIDLLRKGILMVARFAWIYR